MHKIIFKFTMVVTSAIAGHTEVSKLDVPIFFKPEIRVEKVKFEKEMPKVMSTKKTAVPC